MTTANPLVGLFALLWLSNRSRYDRVRAAFVAGHVTDEEIRRELRHDAQVGPAGLRR